MQWRMKKRIALASDHAGFTLKQAILADLQAGAFDVQDFGVHSTDRADYPDYAKPVVLAIGNGQADCGILICGSGQGMAMAANRFPHIRAALCRDVDDAELARLHNDANVLCLGERKTSILDAKSMIYKFLSTEFEGGRHLGRVNKLGSISN
jgi:ribose 5-phosphate isomerase B